MSLIRELQQRNVFRVGAAYLVIGWLLLQVASVVTPILEVPTWVGKLVLLLVAIGFPVALVLAWALELTPEGLVRHEEADAETVPAPAFGRKFDFVIIGLLAVALGYFVWESRFAGREDLAVGARTVAVLPFVNLSSDPDQAYFVDGLTEEILNSLARLPELKVTARTSAFHFKGKDLPIAEIAETLGVEHVVEGSVRRQGNQLRVTAQLIRAADGFHLWSETYDRPADKVFEVQEDVAENIAGALDILLDDAKRSRMFAAGTRNVAAFEAFLRGRMLYDRGHRVFSPEDRWAANGQLEEAIRLDPGFSAAYSLHHDAYAHFLMQDMPAADRTLTDVEALEQIRRDFAEATRTARDPRLRIATQLSGAVFSESWRDVPAVVRELDEFVGSGRAEIRGPGWSHMLLVAIGESDLGLRRAQNTLRNDPLDPLSYADAAGAAMALGDLELAMDYVRQGLKLAPDHVFLRRTEAIALCLAGRVEEGAGKLVALGSEAPYGPLAHALLGHDEEARERASLRAAQSPRDGGPIWVFAELGDNEMVTRLTRMIDASPVGALSFLRLIYYSGGYVPFDMEAAPNFRDRLRSAGADPARLKRWTPLSESG